MIDFDYFFKDKVVSEMESMPLGLEMDSEVLVRFEDGTKIYFNFLFNSGEICIETYDNDDVLIEGSNLLVDVDVVEMIYNKLSAFQIFN